jgi:molybdopterin converting factor subunit 1
MRIAVKLFARLRDITGASELERHLPDGATAGSLWTSLTGEFPGLAAYTGSISMAVNADYARPGTALADGDEVAFLPPVSGGAEKNFVRAWCSVLGPCLVHQAPHQHKVLSK